MTRFRGTHPLPGSAGPALRSYSYKSGRNLTRVRDFHPIPLFSENKNACPIRFPDRVAHLPQKPMHMELSDIIITILRLAVNTPRHTELA